MKLIEQLCEDHNFGRPKAMPAREAVNATYTTLKRYPQIMLTEKPTTASAMSEIFVKQADGKYKTRKVKLSTEQFPFYCQSINDKFIVDVTEVGNGLCETWLIIGDEEELEADYFNIGLHDNYDQAFKEAYEHFVDEMLMCFNKSLKQ